MVGTYLPRYLLKVLRYLGNLGPNAGGVRERASHVKRSMTRVIICLFTARPVLGTMMQALAAMLDAPEDHSVLFIGYTH